MVACICLQMVTTWGPRTDLLRVSWSLLLILLLVLSLFLLRFLIFSLTLVIFPLPYFKPYIFTWFYSYNFLTQFLEHHSFRGGYVQLVRATPFPGGMTSMFRADVELKQTKVEGENIEHWWFYSNAIYAVVNVNKYCQLSTIWHLM